MSLIGNYFDSSVFSEGIGYLSVLNNKFSGTSAGIEFVDPNRSALIKGNLFDESFIVLSGNNGGTNVTCNRWELNNGIGIEIIPGSTLPLSWGARGKPTSNTNDNNVRPYFLFGSSGTPSITHYFIIDDVPHVFNYLGMIRGEESGGIANCLEESWPTSVPLANPYWIDTRESLIDLEDEFHYMDSIGTLLAYQLLSLSEPSYTWKLHELGQLKINIQDIVRRALITFNESDSLGVDIWLTRLSPKVIELSKFLTMWYHSEFEDLSDELAIIAEDDSDVLKSASDYMAVISSTGRSIFELDSISLDSLALLAMSSYGNFTNILRTFLDAEYGISIFRPDTIVFRTINWPAHSKAAQVLPKSYTVYPNPSNGCFEIFSLLGNNLSPKVEIFNSMGQIVKRMHIDEGHSPICLDKAAPGLYVVRITDNELSTFELHNLIIN